MTEQEQEQGQRFLETLVRDLDGRALARATDRIRAMKAEPGDDEEILELISGQVARCPYCGGEREHAPRCPVIRAHAFLDRPDRHDQPAAELLDLLLAFVTREDSERRVWGGVYHDGMDWTCLYCGNWGSVSVDVSDEGQHEDTCPVLQAQVFLREVGQQHPAWPWRWQEATDDGWAYEDGRWTLME